MDDRLLTLRVADGRSLTAPTGVWFLALYDIMNPDERLKLFDRVVRIRDRHLKQMEAEAHGDVNIGRTMRTSTDVHTGTVMKRGMFDEGGCEPDTSIEWVDDDTFLKNCGVLPYD